MDSATYLTTEKSLTNTSQAQSYDISLNLNVWVSPSSSSILLVTLHLLLVFRLLSLLLLSSLLLLPATLVLGLRQSLVDIPRVGVVSSYLQYLRGIFISLLTIIL